MQKKMFMGVLILFCMLFILCVCAGAADDPIFAKGTAYELEDVVMLASFGELTVDVEIHVENVGGTDAEVTLLNPDGNICAIFGNAGSVSVSPGDVETYTGSWKLSQSERSQGKVVYTLRYSFADEFGRPITATKPLPIAICVPKLTVGCIVEPSEPVCGENMSVQFHLQNSGTVDLENIRIDDSGVLLGGMQYPLLKVGEEANLSGNFVAPMAQTTSATRFTYQYTVDGVPMEKSKQLSPWPEVVRPGLRVLLSPNGVTVDPDESVTLVCTLINAGADTRYTDIIVSDPILAVIEQGMSLSPGESITIEKPVTLAGDSVYQFTVTATLNGERSTTMLSNQILLYRGLEKVESEQEGCCCACQKEERQSRNNRKNFYDGRYSHKRRGNPYKHRGDEFRFDQTQRRDWREWHAERQGRPNAEAFERAPKTVLEEYFACPMVFPE